NSVFQTSPQTCTQCKSLIQSGQQFCTNCGAVAQVAFPPTTSGSSFSNIPNTPSSSAPYANSQSLANPPFNTGGQQFTPSYPQVNTGNQQFTPGYTQVNTCNQQFTPGYTQVNTGGQQFAPNYPQPASGYPHISSTPPPPPLSNPYSMPLPSDPYASSQAYPQQHTGTNSQSPVSAKKGSGNWRVKGALLLVAVAVIIGTVLVIPHLSGTSPTGTSSTSGTQPISVRTIGSEVIGISDGSTAFDINRKHGSLKQQAANKLKQGDTGAALSLLNQAVATESNDAEALIYKEDLRIASSPHITFVVGAMPSGDSSIVGVSR